MDETFEAQKKENIQKAARDTRLRELSLEWLKAGAPYLYSYNFTWLGLPIIQYPQDIIAMQEIIWQVKPELIIETGIARGGSLIFYASMLELIGGNGLALGIDIEIREKNRVEIEKHPLSKRTKMIEGSSLDRQVLKQVEKIAQDKQPRLVVLDSYHTHDHVLGELEAYSPLVTKGSYLVVFDTTIEDMPAELCSGRPWGPGNNPKTAVRKFLETNDRFIIDSTIDHKLLLSVAYDGYLKCIKD